MKSPDIFRPRKASVITHWVLGLILTFMTATGGWGQTTGDYQSVQTGNWTTLTTWQYYNGISWVTPSGTSPQGWPGQFAGTGAVTIQSGHIVTIPITGITTQLMGIVTVQSTGQLYLTGTNANVTFSLNTPEVNVLSGGSIYFFNKSTLALPANSIIKVTTGGMTGDGCNNNKVILIGGVTFAVCAGAPGSIYTFAEVMAAGGTIDAIITTNAPQCEGTVITLDGSYSGTAGTTTAGGSTTGVNYSWSVTGPGGYSETATTQNTTIPNTALPGTYNVSLTVSTYKSSQLYTNTQIILALINPMPTLTGAYLDAPACEGFPAIIGLTGLVPSTTSSIHYTIAGGSAQTAIGVIADGSGTALFPTINLALANSGQTLQITGITITSASPNCTETFTQEVPLTVYPTGRWLGVTSTDWSDASNWCGGIPVSTTNVHILTGTTFQPVIGAAGGMCNNITIETDASLAITGSNALSVYGNWTTNGTFTANSSTVSFVGSGAAQTISGTSVFFNLAVNNPSGVISISDVSVNGILHTIINPSSTQGSLHLYDGSTMKTLTMGATASNTGVGDVTGRILRTIINPETTYTFGNPNTSIRFYNAGIESMPTQLKFIVRIGVTHPQKTNTIQRYYEIIRTGGSLPARFSLQLKYLGSELNSNTETNLVFWDHHVPYDGESPHEHGKTEQNLTENWITIAGHGISYLVQNEYTGEIAYIDETQTPQNQSKIWMISGKESASDFVWLGAANSNWDVVTNWSGNTIPSSTSDVIIPASTPYPAILPDNTTRQVKSIRIYSGGSLQGGSGSTLEVFGALQIDNGTASWDNQGSFTPGTSTVVFKNIEAAIAGITNFYNLSIPSDNSLSLLNGSITRVAETFDKSGNLDSYYDGPTLFGFNGNNQSVVVPANAEYYHLELSGTGTKTLPSQSLSVLGDFLISGTTDVSQSNLLNIGGIFSNNSSNVIGVSMGSTVVFNGTQPQIIGGTSTTIFNNLTVNNITGLVLDNHQTVNGTLDFTNGLITTGSNNTFTIGSAGSITNATSTKYVNGKLARVYSEPGTKYFPIGKGGNYRPLSLNYTALTGTSTVMAEQMESTIPGTIPSGVAVQQGRHWAVTESGESAYTYDITLDGTPFTPGTGSPLIVKGDGSSNTSIAATYTAPNFTASGLTGLSNFAVASDCQAPTITAQPGTPSAVCDGAGTATISVSATGTSLSYQWEMSPSGTGGTFSPVADGGVYTGAASNSLSITNPALSMNGYAYRVVVPEACGSSATSNAVILSVNANPTVTVNSGNVCDVDLPFTITATPSPSGTYTYAWTVPAGVTDPGNVASFPAPTAGTYSVIVTDGNGCTGDGSGTLSVNPTPQGSLSGGTICIGEAGLLTWTATIGTGPYTIDYSDGTLTYTAYNVYSGTPFAVFTNPATTTTYNLVTVTDNNSMSCPRTSEFTSGSAVITVNNYTISGTLKYNNAAKTPMSNVTLNLKGGNLSTEGTNTTTLSNGSYSFPGLCNGNYTITVTQNNKPVGSINTTDAAQANTWGVNPEAFVPPIEKVRFFAGDVTDDLPPYVNSTDANRIQLYYVYGTAFDRDPWSYWIAGQTITSNGDPNIPVPADYAIHETISVAGKTLNLLAQVTGDFNGSYTPGSLKASSSTLFLTYGETILAGTGTEYELPLRTVSLSEPGAVSIVLDIPADLMEVTDVTMPENDGQLDWIVNGSELRIGWSSRNPLILQSGEELLVIRLKTTAAFTSGQSIRLALATDPLNELADEYGNVFPDVILETDVLEASTTGLPGLPAIPVMSLASRPNPFYDQASLTYTLPYEGHVTLEIADIMGHRVSLLLDEKQSAGKYSMKVDANSLQPGVYITTLRLQSAQGDLVRKVKILRAW